MVGGTVIVEIVGSFIVVSDDAVAVVGCSDVTAVVVFAGGLVSGPHFDRHKMITAIIANIINVSIMASVFLEFFCKITHLRRF